MPPEEFDEPSNETDRRIFHILSHGQKRKSEIIKLAKDNEERPGNIKNRIPKTINKYQWVKKEEDGNKTFYYRTDIGRQPDLQKPPANHEDVEELLTGIEFKLGIKSRDRIGIRNPISSTLPNLFHEMLYISNNYSKVLTTDEHINRFFNIFDEIIQQTINGYDTEEPSNYPAKTHALFYTVVARQHESWKEGHANEQYNKRLQYRLDDLVELLDTVPPEIGNPIMRILAIASIEQAQKGFEKILRSNKYSASQLEDYAEYCYIYPNDSKKMVNRLSMISIECENEEITRKVGKILDSAGNYKI